MSLSRHWSSTYRAFILRMWVEEGDLQTPATVSWRFSLERIGQQDETPPARRGFASVEELLAYLQTEMRPPG